MHRLLSQPELTRISVVTPTLERPDEISGLLTNLMEQTFLPYEAIIVDGDSTDVISTEATVASVSATLAFHCHY